MKTNRTHRFLSLIMTLLVTMSSFSMSIRSHYCGDDLIEVSLFSNTESCTAGETCSAQKETANFECCYDIIDVVESHEFLKTGSFEDFNTVHKNFFSSYLIYTVESFESIHWRPVPSHMYKSPNLIFDIHLLDEVYLI